MTSRMLLVIALLSGGLSGRAGELMVFAAASLADALKEAGSQYQSQTGTLARFNFAASSILARQIQEGARADIFFSADEAKVDQLERRGLITAGTRVSLLSNSLVVAVEKEGPVEIGSLEELKRLRRISIAEPSTVPAGIYARQALEEARLWKELRARVVPTENVRGALAAVEAGNVDAAIVYKTDAAFSKKVRIALVIPSKIRISYSAALISETKSRKEAEQFLQFLKSGEAAAIFERFGFIVFRPAAPRTLTR